jgi:hypothetical protein
METHGQWWFHLIIFYQCWDGKLSGGSVTVLCVLECGDGLTAVKIYIFVFRRAARISSECVLNDNVMKCLSMLSGDTKFRTWTVVLLC